MSVPVLVSDPRHRYGAHISVSGLSLGDIFTKSLFSKCYTCQIFLGSRQSYDCKTISSQERDIINTSCLLLDKTIHVHAPYVINLSKTNPCDGIHTRSMNCLRKHLYQVAGLPIDVVIHIGARGTRESVSLHINELVNEGSLIRGSHQRIPHHLLLETSAGQGTSIGGTWDDLRHIFEGIDRNMTGLCIDTAHLFGSGMCDFSDHQSIVNLFDNCEDVVGRKRPVDLVHINDSRRFFNSKKDAHFVLGGGYIWGPGTSGETGSTLVDFLSRCFEEEIDLVSESVPKIDIETMRLISNSLK